MCARQELPRRGGIANAVAITLPEQGIEEELATRRWPPWQAPPERRLFVAHGATSGSAEQPRHICP